MSEDEDIIKGPSIYQKYDLTPYSVAPKILDWDIGLDKKYTYQYIKDLALEKFAVSGPVNTPQEKIIAKMTVTPHIMNKFEEIIQMLNDKFEDFLNNDLNVQQYLQDYPSMKNSFVRSMREELGRYKTKIENIHKAWYLDWLDYGLIEDYEPLLRGFARMGKTGGAQLQSRLNALFDGILKDNPGNVKNNPLKYWITSYVKTKLSEIKSIRREVDDVAYNADTFTSDSVENRLNQYVLEIPKIPSNSITAAYYKVEEIMTYVENFADINHEISVIENITFFDRVNTLKIIPGYNKISAGVVQKGLRDIYAAMGRHVNHLHTFRDFMKKGNERYFGRFKTTEALLFEIYFIRTSNNEINRNTFHISNLIAMYDEYLANDKFEYRLDVKKSASVSNVFAAIGHGIARGAGRLVPEFVKYWARN